MRAIGGLREFLEHYAPLPVYTHAKVTVHIDNPWGPDSEDKELMPIKVVEFLDILEPSVVRTRSKLDYVTITWNKDTDWSYTKKSDGTIAEEWEKKGMDGWHEQVGDEKHGWAAWRYFLAHYEDEDVEEGTRRILADE